MKGKRREKETSKCIQTDRGSHTGHKEIEAKNVWNERDRNTKKQKRGRAWSQQYICIARFISILGQDWTSGKDLLALY